MKEEEIKMKLKECFDALNETGSQQSFTVDKDFYGGITVTFDLIDDDEFYATVNVKDNGVLNGKIAYASESVYGVSSLCGGEYEDYLYDDELPNKFVFGRMSSDIYESVTLRHEGFFIKDKINFFKNEFTVVEIANNKVFIADSEKVYETEVYSIGPMTGLMLYQENTNDNPIIVTKGVLI